MNDTAHIYRAEILRAVLGPKAIEARAHDLHRVNQFAEHLAECEEALTILRAKGYGVAAGTSLLDIARSMPENVRVLLDGLSRRTPAAPDPAPPSAAYPSLGEVHDVWSSR